MGLYLYWCDFGKVRGQKQWHHHGEAGELGELTAGFYDHRGPWFLDSGVYNATQ